MNESSQRNTSLTARLAGDDTAERAASTELPGAASPSAPAISENFGSAVPRGTGAGATPGSVDRTVMRQAIREAIRHSEADWRKANEQARACAEFIRLTEVEHYTLTGAARALGISAARFCGEDSMLSRWLRGGLAALLPQKLPGAESQVSELTQQIEALGWFIPAARFFYLLTNRTNNSGSVPEAIRRTISLPHLPIGWSNATRKKFLRSLNRAVTTKVESVGVTDVGRVKPPVPVSAATGIGMEDTEAQSGVRRLLDSGSCDLPVCPEELRETILARQAAGQPLVPERVARKITSAAVVVRQRRNPTETSLDYLNASGSLFFITDPKTGERRPPLTGEVIEADDATINFPVCVPWSLGGDPCSDRYGVKVGRFQWLVAIDAARRYVTAWTYVMRPRSSYRAEDALVLMRAHCLQHGIPAQWRFEQGVWKSNLVKHAVAGMGSTLHTVWSPHQKPYIEGLFNTLWTKLSVQFPDSDVGRFRGEIEASNDLLTACQRGHKDPRRHFPMLDKAVAAFRETIEEKNRTPVESTIGRWIPAEAWAQREARRPLDGETEWLFSPYVKEWTVRGMLVGGRVPLFEDLSVPFDFSADWLAQYDGARVRCHFNPAAPRCAAMLVLAENFRGKTAGEVLGLATQINELAGYARLVLGWGDDPTNAGRLARQRNASALRREVRAVVPHGASGYAASEERDGVAAITKIEKELPKEDGGESGDNHRGRGAAVAAEISVPDRAARLREIEELERANAHLFT